MEIDVAVENADVMSHVLGRTGGKVRQREDMDGRGPKHTTEYLVHVLSSWTRRNGRLSLAGRCCASWAVFRDWSVRFVDRRTQDLNMGFSADEYFLFGEYTNCIV